MSATAHMLSMAFSLLILGGCFPSIQPPVVTPTPEPDLEQVTANRILVLGADGKWTQISSSKAGGERLRVLGSSAKGDIYALKDDGKRPAAFGLLDAGTNAGITLTESQAMLPTSAVSGFYFAHPESQYFGVARIGRDQLADYATRAGVDVATAERWLRPNLD